MRHWWGYKSYKHWVCQNCKQTTEDPTNAEARKDNCPGKAKKGNKK